jgi:photosystem II stability/assembly factor-like uncharacterized protein
MKLLAGLFLLMAARSFAMGQWVEQSSGVTTDFRGLSAVSDKIVWASGTKGSYIRTVDGGKTWKPGVVPGAEGLDFRDVDAVSADVAYLLSIGKGESSRIYKTNDGGQTWTLQFKNTHPEAFFDAMAFWDEKHGVAMSDPVDGRFVIIRTEDGGATWRPVSPENIPPAMTNEGGFAASGTCIAVEGKSNAWFATGGAEKARVFRSTDGGQTWAVGETPILANIPSAGVFSIAFTDSKNGVVVGGDYQKPKEAEKNIALTANGGKTWTLVEQSKPPGFRSGVAYIRRGSGASVITVGTSGSDYSVDGKAWAKLDEQNYNVVSFDRRGNGWAAGPKGRIAKYLGASRPGFGSKSLPKP